MNGFRPWCPICNDTSPPGSLACVTCGLRLYPRGVRPVPPPAENDDDDDDELVAVRGGMS